MVGTVRRQASPALSSHNCSAPRRQSESCKKTETGVSVTAWQSLYWTLKFDFHTVFMPLNIFPYPFKNNLFLALGHIKTKIDWNFFCRD